MCAERMVRILSKVAKRRPKDASEGCHGEGAKNRVAWVETRRVSKGAMEWVMGWGACRLRVRGQKNSRGLESPGFMGVWARDR